MDLTQLLEELIFFLIVIELVELGYHIYEMRRYKKKMDLHVAKMDAHIMKMDQHMSGLETQMTKLDKLVEQISQEKRD